MDFAEIELANAKLRLLRDAKGAISLEVAGTGGLAALQFGVSLDASRLEFWPVHGVNMNPAPEAPMVPVFLISDKERFFGRSCPKCEGYFRTVNIANVSGPPILFETSANLVQFTTKNQLQFIDEVRKKFLAGFSGDEVEEIDLEAIARTLPNNRPTLGILRTTATKQLRPAIRCGNRL